MLMSINKVKIETEILLKLTQALRDYHQHKDVHFNSFDFMSLFYQPEDYPYYLVDLRHLLQRYVRHFIVYLAYNVMKVNHHLDIEFNTKDSGETWDE